MSLNYDLSAIPEENRTIIAKHDDQLGNYKAGERIMSPITNALIWATLGIGMGEITAENVYEFYGRLRIQEALNGAYLTRAKEGGGFESVPITLEQVKAHIGLRTNVFPQRSNSEFLEQVFSEVARADGGKVVGFKHDYQDVVQWARGLVDAACDGESRHIIDSFTMGLDGSLPSREKYPLIDHKGNEIGEDED